MDIEISQQGGREEAQIVFERILTNLNEASNGRSWYGIFTVSFKSIFESSHHISQKETDAIR